ncbi:MAG: hypothetical protein M1831_006218 [Alyxoria varia]|nr:MAG: hypothetical protein M1831_006218 [Alyxoria varia]
MAGSKPAATVPTSLISVIDRVITLHKRHANWWQARPSHTTERSREGHLYFVRMSEHVKNALRPLCHARSQVVGTTEGGSDEDAADPPGQLGNLSANHNMDEPTEDILNAPTTLPTHRAKSVQFVVVAESTLDLEVASLAAYCLFVNYPASVSATPQHFVYAVAKSAAELIFSRK